MSDSTVIGGNKQITINLAKFSMLSVEQPLFSVKVSYSSTYMLFPSFTSGMRMVCMSTYSSLGSIAMYTHMQE